MRAGSLSSLPSFLQSRVIGQPAVRRIAAVVQRAELGLSKPGRPKGSFLLLGPTGTGKTETVLALVEALYGDTGPGRFHRFDMAEFQDPASIGRLIGSSGSSRPLLGDAIDRINASGGGVLLFDEIEKADKDLSTIFLGILDAARVSMADGSLKDLSAFYIVMTSNLGSAEAINMEHVPYSTLERHVLMAAQSFFRPELYARFTEKLVYSRLSYDVQRAICEGMLRRELQHVADKVGISISYGPELLTHLIRIGYSKKLGARPMRDAIERTIGDAVAAYLLAGDSRAFSPNQLMRLSVTTDGQVRLSAERAMIAPPPSQGITPDDPFPLYEEHQQPGETGLLQPADADQEPRPASHTIS